jgi:hypothetical protein
MVLGFLKPLLWFSEEKKVGNWIAENIPKKNCVCGHVRIFDLEQIGWSL